jgi:hypothetical protein
MLNFFELTSFLGNLLRVLGLALFGLAVGWLTLKTFIQAEKNWPLQAAIYLGFLFFIAITLAVVSPGSGGALSLGAAIALLYWGNKKEDKSEITEEVEEGE